MSTKMNQFRTYMDLLILHGMTKLAPMSVTPVLVMNVYKAKKP